MIEHTKSDAYVNDNAQAPLSRRWCEVPHECSDKSCPGVINWRKLELFPELLDALRELVPTAKLDRATADDIAQVIAEAEEVAGD